MSESIHSFSHLPIQELAKALATEVSKCVDQRISAFMAQERILDPLLAPDQVKRYLNVSDAVLQYLRDSRQLAYVRVKGKYMYKACDIERFISSNYFQEKQARRLDDTKKAAGQKGGRA